MHNIKYYRTQAEGVGQFRSYGKPTQHDTLPRITLRLASGEVKTYYARDLRPFKGDQRDDHKTYK
jgi:hypothetical protein